MSAAPALPHACPTCGQRFVVVVGEAAPAAPRCACGGTLAETPLPSGVYEIRRARRASVRPLDEPAPAPLSEPDSGYGVSHGYGPSHGGPSGPGDVAAEGDAAVKGRDEPP